MLIGKMWENQSKLIFVRLLTKHKKYKKLCRNLPMNKRNLEILRHVSCSKSSLFIEVYVESNTPSVISLGLKVWNNIINFLIY
jgi:hypothetical protein